MVFKLAAALAALTLPWSAADRDALQKRLDPIFAGPAFQDAGLVVTDISGETVFARNAAAQVVPASTQKLLTAVAALNRFGPNHRFVTRFASLAPPHDGVIDGPLWLIGAGDPYFTRDDLRNGIAVLARLGVRRVTGPLVIDDTLFAGSEVNPQWGDGDIDAGFAAPISALTLDQGTIEAHVWGDPAGGPARVTLVPHSAMVSIGAAPIVRDGGRTSVDFTREAPDKNTFNIIGTVGTGNPVKLWIPVLGFSAYVADAAARMLAEGGITAGGGVVHDVAPLASTTLWAHRSPPISVMLKEILHHSNNHAADQFLRLLATSRGVRGSDAAGVDALEDSLKELGVNLDAVVLYDGSGLSPQNRVSALALAQAVAAELRGPNAAVYLAALPLAGKEGTVRQRQVGAALGRARAKTGHLTGVDALAGTVLTKTHGRVSFAFVANGPLAAGGAVETAQDDALDALAEF